MNLRQRVAAFSLADTLGGMQTRLHLRLPAVLAFAAAALSLGACSSATGVHVAWFSPVPAKAAATAEVAAAEAVASVFDNELDHSRWKAAGEPQTGHASWYGVACNGGTHTASMERLRDTDLTAAHKTLPMGTMVQVKNLDNGRSVIVRINDRGPYIKGRIIDVTPAAADALGMRRSGVAECRIQVIEPVNEDGGEAVAAN